MIQSKGSKAGDFVVVFFCVLLILVCVLPLLNIVSRSLSATEALIQNQVGLLPVGWNLDAYKMVLTDSKYTNALLWTAALTAICTIVSMALTVCCAYPLTYEHLKGRKALNAIILFTMYFSAGTIPNYLLYKDLGLLDNPLVLIIPNSISVFNMIILRSFFFGIPESLRESTEIDGAGPIRVLWSIYLPLSTPALATLSLFYAVGRWNGYTDAMMYMVNNRAFHPIQLLLYNILNTITSIDVAQEGFANPGLSDALKAATVVFATVPILLIYPWLQKYFIAGVTLGAVKE